MRNILSTRDSDRNVIGYDDAVLAGLAPDGGLYVPDRFPKIDQDTLLELGGLPYYELFFRVRQMLVGEDMPLDVQSELARLAYAPEKFPVEDGNIVPVREVSDGLYLQNLSLGPTAAFKDMALQPLAADMNYVLSTRGQSLRILGATSGDTGSAAEAAVKGLGSLSLYMLSPITGMSDFQRAQMGELSGGNITNISVRGVFDDCQDMVKALKEDPEFADLGAVNSINWGRIASQIPYYVAGYLQVASEVGEPVDVTVPSGNFGNALSAYYAKKMGVPIRRIVIATNENSVLHTVVTEGIYRNTQAQVTSSPSMDISKASNFERLVYDIFDQDPERVKTYMQQFAEQGEVMFADHDVSNQVMENMGFASGTSDHASRIDSIQYVYTQSESVIDPHTADGVTVARQLREEDVPMIVMETALAVKFEDTIQQALGFVPQRPARFANLVAANDEDFLVIENDIEQLKSILRAG